MKAFQARLEKLRRDAADCKAISESATDKQKRDLFDRFAAHLGTLADRVEQEMLGRKGANG